MSMRAGGPVSILERVGIAAIGGALIFYGIQQRSKARQAARELDRSTSRNEGFLGIGIGAALLFVALTQ